MISLVMPTYNRAHTLGRAIRSVLVQSLADWELVIVDGASTDDTARVIAEFRDARVRYVRQPSNEGVTAGRNRGLDEARGSWVGMLDSDDELTETALETLVMAQARVSPHLDAISCNCVDARTGRLTGRGLHHDRFLTVPLVLERARGEHWGIFHRRLLAGRRFNPEIRGYEGHLWYRIHDGALWYYVHRGLRVYHREGVDRNTRRANIDYDLHRQIFDHDRELLRLYARWSKRAFMRFTRTAAIEFLRESDHEHFDQAVRGLRAGGAHVIPRALRVAMKIRSKLSTATATREVRGASSRT